MGNERRWEVRWEGMGKERSGHTTEWYLKSQLILEILKLGSTF